ncbi:uncharacterized protein GGS22DRAFT_185832 [Annulohypoxylon maeteangense]|uniref:uncharacterized protein n=1 Tax=Annulohypoxylon maeteangense TaxID=1927788 RepID=UPI00200881F2|nr:uncharacterized protein GGS22DRAFT_185832 [Annulohypoxylon maeteangense]KAI0888452.1 hypothetical protein GGS22DRAFT_185832 [Annulohypoxylon maeteangense]
MENQVVNRLFAGKSEKIAEQCKRFHSQPTAKVDVDAYLNNTDGHVFLDEPKWIKKNTPFTEYKGKVFAYGANGDSMLIGNHSSFAKVQYPGNEGRAGMSMIHILGIPKKNLFNGVSLNPDSVVIIDEMISCFQNNWASKDFRTAILKHQEEAIEGAYKVDKNKETYLKAMVHHRELESMIHTLTVDDFTFGLHLWPDHSIGHLHLHIIATPPWCRQYSTFVHDDKTKDALEVRDYIHSH